MNIKSSAKTIKIICITLGVLMLLSILPYLFLTGSAFPLGDDYGYTLQTHDTWTSTHSIVKTIATAWEKTITIYKTWQGSISGVFLMAIGPMTFSLTLYRISLLLNNLIFIFTVFFAYIVFLNGRFKIPKHITYFLASLTLFSCYNFMPSAFQAFYWNNGSTYYIITLCLAMIFGCLLEFLYKREEKSKLGLMLCLSFLALFFGLNNLPNAVFIFSLLSMILLFSFYKKLHIKSDVLIIYLFLVGGFVINALAPGNEARMAIEGDSGLGVLSTLKHCFIASFKEVVNWYAKLSVVPAALLVFTPYLYKNMSKYTKYINPIVLIIISYLLLASHYTPTLYSYGYKIYGRVENVRYIMVQIFIIVNYLNLLGYISKLSIMNKLSKMISGKLKFINYVAYTGLLVVAAYSMYLVAMHIYYNPLTGKDLVLAYKSGQLQEFVDQSDARLEILNDENIKIVEFEPLTAEMSLLGFDQISPDKESNINIIIADYYDKDQVFLSEK